MLWTQAYGALLSATLLLSSRQCTVNNALSLKYLRTFKPKQPLPSARTGADLGQTRWTAETS